MAYVTDYSPELNGFKKRFKRAVKKVAFTPFKIAKKVVLAPVRIAKKPVKRVARMLVKPARRSAPVYAAPVPPASLFTKPSLVYSAPLPARGRATVYNAPIKPASTYTKPAFFSPARAVKPSPVLNFGPETQIRTTPAFQPSQESESSFSQESESSFSPESESNFRLDVPAYDSNDLERPMTDDEIRQYVAAQQDVNDDLNGIDGFKDRLKKLVKKAAVVVATVKGGPVGKKLAERLMRKKGAPADQAAVIDQAGDEAVSDGIPRAVGRRAAKSFFTPKNMAIGTVALIGVGGLVYFLSRKRGR